MFIASGQQASVTQYFCMLKVPKTATLIRMIVVCHKKSGIYTVQLNNLSFPTFREHKRSEINEELAFKKRLC
jgi:hypothetical protein